MRAHTLALVAVLTIAAFAALPEASASDTCTMYTGCLDTCNPRFCLSIPDADDVERGVEDILGLLP